MQAAPDTAAPDPSNIQGNLAGFNKDHQRFLFLKFPDKASGQKFLAAIAGDIASCAEVQAFNALFKQIRARRSNCVEHNTVEATWLNIALSFTGLQLLEAPELDSLPEDFRAGMKARAEIIGDKDQSAPTGDASAWIEPLAIAKRSSTTRQSRSKSPMPALLARSGLPRAMKQPS